MKIANINFDRTVVIAETACAHNGSFDEAKALIDAAVDARADIVQLIVFSTEDSIAPSHDFFGFIDTLKFNKSQWSELVQYAKQKDILVCATVEDDLSVDIMADLDVDILKIHSCDNTNPELIERVAKLGKPMMLSVGALSFEEIEAAIHSIKAQGNEDIFLVYGFQNYPTKTEGINLKIIQTLKQRFNLPVGYADHTDGDSELALYLPLLALPFGADFLDKHITLDRSKKGADFESSLNPDEFKKFVSNLRILEKALGDGVRHPFTPEELEYRRISKKSIMSCKSLLKGHILSRDDLVFLRTNKPELAPSESDKVIGKILNKDKDQFENIVLEDLE